MWDIICWISVPQFILSCTSSLMSSCCCAVKISIAPINLIINSSTVVLPEKPINQLITVTQCAFILSHIPMIQQSLPWITFRTSLDVRFPMTIRSRGNWSVLYVRMVCVTTLPKCLVHMVSSLKENNQYLIYNNLFKIYFKIDFRLKWKKIHINEPIIYTEMYILHVKKHVFTPVASKRYIGNP